MGGQRQKYSRSVVTVIDEKLLFTILIALMPQERATELHILKSHYIFYDRFNRHLQILARERVKDLPVNEHVCDFEKKLERRMTSSYEFLPKCSGGSPELTILGKKNNDAIQ